jgi:xanthine dehydrogenase YagS FAD-binding subunit
MKEFDYRNAETINDAVSLLKTGNATILAGGTDLLNLLKMGVLSKPPETLVNIKKVSGMDEINENMSGLNIGALVKISNIASSELIRVKYPVLSEAAKSIASPAIRNMGTIAGNLCQEVQCWYYRRSFLTGNTFNCLRKGGRQCYAVDGDNRYHAILGGKGCYAVCPSDTAIALTALDATIITSRRTVPISDIFTVMGNTLNDDEIITSIHIPEPESKTRQAFIKFTLRPAIDFAIVSTAAVITIKAEKISDARIILGAVAPVPFRAIDAENVLKNKKISDSLAETAADTALRDAKPLSHNKYKIQIAKTLVKRVILSSKPSEHE